MERPVPPCGAIQGPPPQHRAHPPLIRCPEWMGFGFPAQSPSPHPPQCQQVLPLHPLCPHHSSSLEPLLPPAWWAQGQTRCRAGKDTPSCLVWTGLSQLPTGWGQVALSPPKCNASLAKEAPLMSQVELGSLLPRSPGWQAHPLPDLALGRLQPSSEGQEEKGVGGTECRQVAELALASTSLGAMQLHVSGQPRTQVSPCRARAKRRRQGVEGYRARDWVRGCDCGQTWLPSQRFRSTLAPRRLMTVLLTPPCRWPCWLPAGLDRPQA